MNGWRALSRAVGALIWVVAVGGAVAQPLPKTPGMLRAEEESRAREEAERDLNAAQGQVRKDRERAAADVWARQAEAALESERRKAREAPSYQQAQLMAMPSQLDISVLDAKALLEGAPVQSRWPRLSTAAERGDLSAITLMAIAKSERTGTSKGGPGAVPLRRSAAARRHGRALVNLGDMLESGRGVALRGLTV